LDKYVTEYLDASGNIWYGYTETEFIAPNIIQNIVTNTDFKSTNGWQGKYRLAQEEYANKNLQYGAICTAKSYPDILD
jgi:hypothetical protein